MNRKSEFLKNIVILAFGTIIPKSVNFIILPLLTKYLTQIEFGTYDLILTLGSLLMPIATLQIQSAAFRFLIKYRYNLLEQKKIISNVYYFVLLAVAISSILFFFLSYKINILTRLLITMYLGIDIMLSTSLQIVRGLGCNRAYSISTCINSFVSLSLVVLFVRYLNYGLNGILIAFCVASISSLAYVIISQNMLTYISIKILNKISIIEYITYSWPMLPNSISSWVMNLSDRLVITFILGIQSNAVYAVANKLPMIFTIFQNLVTLAWQENASISSQDQDKGIYYSQTFSEVLNVFAGLVAILITCTPFLFRILIKGNYENAYFQIPILYVAGFYSSISGYLGGIYIAHLQTKKIGFTTIAAAISNLVTNLLLINRIGIYAASLSTAISYFFLFWYRVYDIRKFENFQIQNYRVLLNTIILVLFGVFFTFRNAYIDIINLVLAIIFAIVLNYKLVKIISKKLINISLS